MKDPPHHLLYEGAVEMDIYSALRERIQLIQIFFGRLLQPILVKQCEAIADETLGVWKDQQQKRREKGTL